VERPRSALLRRDANGRFVCPHLWGLDRSTPWIAPSMATSDTTLGRLPRLEGSRLVPLAEHGAGLRADLIAALYVETGGVYCGLPDVDPWDEARDARNYAGPWPVVAHPPCARWCRFAPGIETRYGYAVGDDGGCFAAALDAVKRYGGVLEHPAGSLAWDAFGLPKPQSSEGWTVALADEGGAVCYVEQGRYGHPMKKGTWLYACGVELSRLRWGRRLDSERGEFKWGSRLYKPSQDRNRPRIDKEHSRTTVEFRNELLDIARSHRPTRSEQSLEGAAVNGLTPVGQEASSR
jgi:hypothetical protein